MQRQRNLQYLFFVRIGSVLLAAVDLDFGRRKGLRVEQRSDNTPQDRSGPVHLWMRTRQVTLAAGQLRARSHSYPVIVPDVGDDRSAEASRRIHARAGQFDRSQVANGYCESNRQRSNVLRIFGEANSVRQYRRMPQFCKLPGLFSSHTPNTVKMRMKPKKNSMPRP